MMMKPSKLFQLLVQRNSCLCSRWRAIGIVKFLLITTLHSEDKQPTSSTTFTDLMGADCDSFPIILKLDFVNVTFLHCVSKNDATLKLYSSKLYDRNIQKTVGKTIVKFTCFSFHVGLLVITLSSLKLHAENNACMHQSAVKRAFSCSTWELRRRSLWIIRETDDWWIPASCEISLTVRWLRGLSSWLSISDSTVSTLSSACALRLPLPGRLSTVLNFTSSLLMAAVLRPNCYKLPSVVSCNLYIHTDFKILSSLAYWSASKLAHLLDTASKFVSFSVSGLKDEKLTKKQTYMKNETCKLYSGVFWNISAKCHQNRSL